MKYVNNNFTEQTIKRSNASSYNEDVLTKGTLILTNFRIYLSLSEEEKINEVLLKDIKRVSIGGFHVVRIELSDKNYSFFVNNVFSWIREIKKAIKVLN